MEIDWIDGLLKRATTLKPTLLQAELLEMLLSSINKIDPVGINSLLSTTSNRGLILAAAFDLMVAAEYYKSVTSKGWHSCACYETQNYLFYPYTNTCPYCMLNNEFHFTKANKPKSANIGLATSNLLILFLDSLIQRSNRNIYVYKSPEPADILIIDHASHPKTVLCAEIKSSPLLTPALMTQYNSDQLSNLRQGHSMVNFEFVPNQQIYLAIPTKSNTQWNMNYYQLGSINMGIDWAYQGLIQLLRTDLNFFADYIYFWFEAFKKYSLKQPSDVYWSTNGSGQPTPRPVHWPVRAGSQTGFESISDGKTSVGMDRTDDIKKSVYQILSLGIKGKSSKQYNCLVGIISNIHAVRHFNDYLAQLQNIIWVDHQHTQISKASDLPDDTPIYHLFDGLIAFTQVSSTNAWINDIFQF